MFEYTFYGGGAPVKATIWEHNDGSLGMQHNMGCKEHNRGSRWVQLGSWKNAAQQGLQRVERYYYWILGFNNEIVNKYLLDIHESP